MRKFVALFLVVVMCISFAACSMEEEKTDNKKVEENEGKKEKSVLIEKNGFVYIRHDRFGELLEKVELTTENWQDYIKVYSYEEEIIIKDAFGEVESTEIVTEYRIGAGNERYHQFQDAVIELKNKETGELATYGLGDNLFVDSKSSYVNKEFNLDDYECTRIKGRLYFVDLPEEAIHSPLDSWGYDHGFILYSSSMITPYQVSPGSKVINRNGSGSWDDFLN